jgi:hypothetical protein
VSIVVVPAVTVAFAGAKPEAVGGGTTVMVTVVEATSPAGLVTERVKVVVLVRGPVGTPVPDTTRADRSLDPGPPVPTVADPPEKVGVRVTPLPLVIVIAEAERVVATGAATT